MNPSRIRMFKNNLPISYKRLSTLIIFVTIQIVLIQTIQAEDGYNRRMPYYNSEDQETMNVRNLAPALKWNDEDQNEDFGNRNQAAQRRSSDNDLEDGLEEEDDEDRDEFKSGSTNHDSYENPSFGESNRAAKDGEDIETFFDRHLGPQEAMESSEPDNEVPISEVPVAMGGMGHRRLPAGDPDDHYEAAASSPLSSIFHSILSAHKRPLVITTSDDSTSGSESGQQQSTSSSTPVGASIRGNTGYVEQATPIAYFTPVAGYEPQAGAATGLAQASPTETGPTDGGGGQEEYAPVREIYISRRPSLLSGASHHHVTQNQYHPGYSTAPRLVHQSSNAHWRGAHSMATHRHPYPAAEDQVDYGRYPVAASYAYQREQAQPEDDQTTVSYGLSFGASPGEPNEEQSADNNADDQSSIDEPAYAPHQSRNFLRHTAPSRAYTNYNYPPAALIMPAGAQQAGYAPRTIQTMQQQQQQQQQQQAPYHGARYHKDPSESVIQPTTNYGQYSGASSNLAKDAASWATRQQLLASLDKEIKTNPYYKQQQAATVPGIQYTAQQSGQRFTAAQPEQRTKKQQTSKLDTDVDTYSSFHTEIDPYKSFTSSARIISEPVQKMSSDVGRKTNKMNADSKGVDASEPSNREQADLLTGPLINMDPQRQPESKQAATNLRVRRENSDDRDNDDADDDGMVWVDDDEDDDNRQHSSSDVNETSQKPEDEEIGQQEANSATRASGGPINPPGVIGGPHSYELSPDDLMAYPTT